MDKRLDLDLLFYFHLLLEVDMLSGGGASPTAIGGFEYGTGVAVRTTAIMSRSTESAKERTLVQSEEPLGKELAITGSCQ